MLFLTIFALLGQISGASIPPDSCKCCDIEKSYPVCQFGTPRYKAEIVNGTAILFRATSWEIMRLAGSCKQVQVLQSAEAMTEVDGKVLFCYTKCKDDSGQQFQNCKMDFITALNAVKASKELEAVSSERVAETIVDKPDPKSVMQQVPQVEPRQQTDELKKNETKDMPETVVATGIAVEKAEVVEVKDQGETSQVQNDEGQTLQQQPEIPTNVSKVPNRKPVATEEAAESPGVHTVCYLTAVLYALQV